MRRARILLLAAALALGLSACATSERYADADRQTYEAVAPELEAYIEADAHLTPEQRERRRALLRSWKARIDAAQDDRQRDRASEGSDR